MYDLSFAVCTFSHETFTTETLYMFVFVLPFVPLCNLPSHLSHPGGSRHRARATIING